MNEKKSKYAERIEARCNQIRMDVAAQAEAEKRRAAREASELSEIKDKILKCFNDFAGELYAGVKMEVRQSDVGDIFIQSDFYSEEKAGIVPAVMLRAIPSPDGFNLMEFRDEWASVGHFDKDLYTHDFLGIRSLPDFLVEYIAHKTL